MRGEKLPPEVSPQTIEHIDGFGNKTTGVNLIRTTHGSVYEGENEPNYIQYHVVDIGDKLPQSPEDIDSIKNTQILNEMEDKHFIEKQKIRAFMEGYWIGKQDKMDGNDDDAA